MKKLKLSPPAALAAATMFLSAVAARCAFVGLLLVGIPVWGVAQTDGLGPVRPPSPFARFPGLYQRRSDLAAAAGQAVPAGVTADTTVQTPNGTFITFDVPAAVFIGTFGISINPAGEIAGYYGDAHDAARPFLRARDGTLTTFDVPNDINGILLFSGPPAINPAGEITGPFMDAENTSHGFLRARDGTFTTFDAPGVGGKGFLQGTVPNAINPAGKIAGYFTDAENTSHGFLREHDGTSTTFDAPGPLSGLTNGLPLLSINPAGDVTGAYFTNGAFHGFLRARDGTLTTFDVPGAGTGTFQGTYPEGINPAGEITGVYSDANGAFHGFLRARDGTFTSFDVPGVGNSGCGFPGTEPSGINPEGEITGFYSDVNCRVHGFLRKSH